MLWGQWTIGLEAELENGPQTPKTELVPRVNSLGKMSNFLPLLRFIVHGSEGSAVPKIEKVI